MSMKRLFLVISMIMVISTPVLAGNLYSQAEIAGSVSSVFPQAGVIMINGSRYEIGKNVQVISRGGAPVEGGITALKSGMAIQYGLDKDIKTPTVTVIVISDERR